MVMKNLLIANAVALLVAGCLTGDVMGRTPVTQAPTPPPRPLPQEAPPPADPALPPGRPQSRPQAGGQGGATSATPQTPAPTSPQGAQNQPEYVRDAQQKIREGKLDEALAIYDKELKTAPDSFQANNQAGVVLDLMGRYDEARKHFAKAIETASTPQQKAQANRSMAMSYAFTRDCKSAAKYETPLYDQYVQANDAFNAGEIANELARICLESGDTDAAAKWYETGRDAGLKEANISPERRDLWEFRWENALARIAARRGQKAEAQKHVEAAKAIFGRATNPEQAQFVPYLVGYVDFYGGDYKEAVAELQKGNQRDPFILALLAQSYEKLGDKTQADEYFRKVLAIPIHNPTGAYARPIAQKSLGK